MSNSDFLKNRKALLISLSLAFFLALTKFIVYYFSFSVSILASSLDSLFDGLITLVSIWILYESARPPDENHKYGHWKFEAFAEFIQSIVISASAFLVMYKAIDKLSNPSNIEHQLWGIIVMTFSVLVSSFISYNLKKTSDSTDSQVLKADAYHYLTDIISNSAVIIVFIAALWWDGVWLDVIISFFIGIIILLTAKTLFVDSFRVLTDHELSVEDIEKISSLLNSSKEISGWHSLRTRKAGSRRYIDAHLEFTPTISLKEAHTKADKIELEIKKILNNVYIALHFDTEDDSKKEQNL